MSEFLNMGGYAFFVWSSYGLTFFFLLLNVFLARSYLRKARQNAVRRINAMEQQNAPEA
ncbi:MAG: heme exporter protein CcmD [Granulosicoccaceae bacterium]